MKKLVAYFSASGVTEKVAKKLADVVNGDLFEIIPKEPYTDEDLDWTNKKSRSSMEMSDKSSRPAVATEVVNISQYDVIYLGFPIWWYIAPTIINTFLEEYDLTGKTIIPFATSGGSDMGRTNEYLRGSCKGATLKEGRRFRTSVSSEELKTWSENV